MAPGIIEDAKGVPFVGPAGSLLRNELRRQHVDPTEGYYMNVVCCAPPGNKVTANQVDACRQNLKDQLDVADAEWVLACGNLAMETLIPHATPHTREKLIQIHGKKVWCVYHPSYILRAKDRGLYQRWVASLEAFAIQKDGYYFEDYRCIYCGDDISAFGPMVCSKHMKQWKIDSKWRYMPPPQLELTLEI